MIETPDWLAVLALAWLAVQVLFVICVMTWTLTCDIRQWIAVRRSDRSCR